MSHNLRKVVIHNTMSKLLYKCFECISDVPIFHFWQLPTCWVWKKAGCKAKVMTHLLVVLISSHSLNQVSRRMWEMLRYWAHTCTGTLAGCG